VNLHLELGGMCWVSGWTKKSTVSLAGRFLIRGKRGKASTHSVAPPHARSCAKNVLRENKGPGKKRKRAKRKENMCKLTRKKKSRFPLRKKSGKSKREVAKTKKRRTAGKEKDIRSEEPV